MKILVLIFLSTLFLNNVTSRKVINLLIITFEGGYSHIGSITPIAKELSKHNINVTILSTNGFAYKNPNESNFRILTNIVKSTKRRVYPSKEFVQYFAKNIWHDYFSSKHMEYIIINQVNSLAITFEENRKFIDDIINQKWDYVLNDELITVFGNVLTQKLIEKQNIKYGIFATARQWDIQSRAREMGQSYVGRPSFIGDGLKSHVRSNVDSFNYGLKILKEKNYELVIVQWLCEKYTRDFVKSLRFLNNEYSQDWIYKNADFSLREYPDKIFYPSTTAVDVIEDGSYCIKEKNEISNDKIRKILDDTMVKDVIYLAFGGAVNFYDAPPSVMNSFLGMFKRFSNITFIWSYKGPELKNLPSNVNIFEWVEQSEILKHSKIKLFISHGGLKSLKEGICHETPMLFLPVFAEQFHNAISAKNYIGSPFINKFYITDDEIIKIVGGMLSNSSYREQIIKAKKMMNDRIIPTLQESAWRIRQFITKSYMSSYTRRHGIKNDLFQSLYFYEIITFLFIILIISKK